MRKEVLPQMMAIGVDEDKFWRSTIRTLNSYLDAHQLKVIERDKAAHRMGSYIYEAIGCSLNGKSYRKKPYYAEEEERMRLERMTEEEKIERVEKIFEMLANSSR